MMSDTEGIGPTPAAVVEIHKQQHEIQALRREVARLTAERDAMKEAARFIPVEERLPVRGKRVEIMNDSGYVEIAGHNPLIEQWSCEDGTYYHGESYKFVVAWRELTQPEGEA